MKTRPTLSVLFDWDAVIRNRHSGFYTFGSGLIDALTRITEDVQITLFYQKRYAPVSMEFLSNLDTRQCSRLRSKECPFKFRWIERLWEILDLPSLEFLAGYHGIYHCFHHFMPRSFGGTKILTVHDLRRYRLSFLYEGSRLSPFERAVKRADLFICVSHATKKDLCSIFGIREDLVHVIHLAVPSNFVCTKDQLTAMKRVLDQKGIKPKRYLVAFSSKDRRKNIVNITKAFEEAYKRLPRDTKLVIIGRINKQDRSVVKKIKNVVSLGEVDHVYPWLRFSAGLVFTSLYEGFGLPILEAFSARVPVITSNCSSMPEVASDAAIIVDPEDVRAISEAVLALFQNRLMADELVRKGERRLKDFSWEKSASMTYKLYKRCMQGPLPKQS